MRISLAQPRDPRAREPHQNDPVARPFVAPAGPRVVLGGMVAARGLVQPVVPSATTMFAPRGAASAGRDGPLVVADTGHHRLLVWSRLPDADATPADLVIGQPGFGHEGRNARGPVGPATFNVPAGVALHNGMLAVADSWNHRVLLWHEVPRRAGAPADLVLGQADFSGGAANRGGPVDASTMYWCSGVAFSEQGLLVADTGNRRVLLWDRIPAANGAPADCVFGQADFTSRDENGGRACAAGGMRWPHDIALCAGRLVVADAGDNRLMVWNAVPTRSGTSCDFVIGQADTGGSDHNGGTYWPTAARLNMPYGVTVAGDRLVVADSANSRLLAWPVAELGPGVAATGLAAQPTFFDKGDNRWGTPVRDSLCWPYGVAAAAGTLVVADSGNSRVLLWDVHE